MSENNTDGYMSGTEQKPTHDFQNYSIQYRVFCSLPQPFRTSCVGRRWRQKLVHGDHPHIHCNPNDGVCSYCQRTKEIPIEGRLYYRVERIWRSLAPDTEQEANNA